MVKTLNEVMLRQRFFVAALFALSCGQENAASSGGGEDGGVSFPDVPADVPADVPPEVGCPENILDGDVDVSSALTLEELRDVTHIRGALAVTGPLSTLEPLGCLRFIDGTLRIQGTSELRTLKGLEGLETTYDITISENLELESTVGFGVREVLDIEDPYATSSIRIRQNPKLSEVRFDNLEHLEYLGLGGCFANGEAPDGTPNNELLGNSVLSRLDAGVLPELASVEDDFGISITGYSELVSINGLVASAAGIAGGRYFLTVEENRRLDIAEVEVQWAAAGQSRGLFTCGNLGEAEQCDCPPGGE